jgi:hypothetical protein
MLSMENLPYGVAIARELHGLGTFGANGPAFDWDFALRTFAGICNSPFGYMRMAVDDDGVYVGAICGRVYPFVFSPRLQGIEDGLYVREGTPKRASIAINLVRGFVDWCLDEKGALIVQTGDIASINSHAVDVLYRHIGFKRFGTIYVFQRT